MRNYKVLYYTITIHNKDKCFTETGIASGGLVFFYTQILEANLDVSCYLLHCRQRL